MATNKDNFKNRNLQNRKNVISKLLNMFNMGIDKDKNIRPITKVRTKEGNIIRFENFPSSVQKLLNYWQIQCHDNAASWENRKLLYQDMDLIFSGSPLLARALKLMAHEVVQADSNMRSVDVEAVPKVKDFILKFFDDIKLEDHILPTVTSIVKYGNAGWALSTNDSGVEEILPVDIYDLIDRVEFTPHEVRKQMNDYSSIANKLNQNQRMKMLLDSIVDSNDFSSYFKSYLFGFQVTDHILPPWRFLHFRNYTTESPFYPFGIPVFIHAVSAYRQYDAAFTLQMAARAANFPIQNYKLSLPNTMKVTEKLKEASEFMLELDNSGMHTIQKEELGVGERIITMADSWEFELISPEINLGRLDDIEMLRDDIIIATGLPRNFLDPNNGAFGNSGIALVQQFKPFAREVFGIQSIFLQNVSQMVKIHMILSGKFKEEEIDFQLTMPYPESQTDRELIGAQSDLLGLANTMLDSIAQRIVGDANAVLPPELVKHVYTKMLPYDSSTIDLYVRDALLSKQEKEEGVGEDAAGATGAETPDESGGNLDFGGGAEGTEETPAETPEPEEPATPPAEGTANESSKKINKKDKFIEKTVRNSYFETRKKLKLIKPSKLKESLDIIIFEESQKKVRDQKIRGKHVLSSKKQYSDFNSQKLWEFKEKRLELLTEERDNHNFWEVEIENLLPSTDEEMELNEILKKEVHEDALLDSIVLESEEDFKESVKPKKKKRGQK